MESFVTAEIPALDFLEKLIMDDKMFSEFSNNKENVFNGFLVDDLKEYLKDYIQSKIHSKQNVTEKFLNRSKYFNDKLNLDIPSFRQISDGFNPEFYNFVMEGLENLSSPLSKARAIYLKLAKVLCYDEIVPAYNQDLSISHVEEHYYSKTSSVTLGNNRVTCNLWAEIYCAFLTKIGIDAKVIAKGKHRLVEFFIEGVRYTADATNSFLDKDNIYLNDLTRVKLNSPTVGFNGDTKEIDQNLGYNPIELIKQYEDFSNNHYPISSMRLSSGDELTDNIKSKLDYLSTMAYHLPQIEAVGYLKQMIKSSNYVFNMEDLSKITPVQIRLRDNEGLLYTSFMVAIQHEDDYIYRLLHIPEGLIEVTKDYIVNLINTNQLEDEKNIPGVGQMNR